MQVKGVCTLIIKESLITSHLSKKQIIGGGGDSGFFSGGGLGFCPLQQWEILYFALCIKKLSWHPYQIFTKAKILKSHIYKTTNRITVFSDSPYLWSRLTCCINSVNLSIELNWLEYYFRGRVSLHKILCAFIYDSMLSI